MNELAILPIVICNYPVESRSVYVIKKTKVFNEELFCLLWTGRCHLTKLIPSFTGQL